MWHLTSSLYTELITVMQRAQYYSNKAKERLTDERQKREIERQKEREREGINNTEQEEKGGTTIFLPDTNKFSVVSGSASGCG